MKDLAPQITRQRLLIEGLYTKDITEQLVEKYLLNLASHLNLRTYSKPIIHSPQGTGKDDNQGFDAFLPLIDSGISLYVWSASKFFAVVLFTCKQFDNEAAINYTQDFFEVTEWVSEAF
ncbi:S-adenosylmethionine decarboxylase [Neptunicella sp. SCSIO 80796]|uniref:S-adenosylmethionine decarboxylase n=1 Tax=Neptunicella plasticusilytica TaxID=3117012 RepID=UPI003A4D9228